MNPPQARITGAGAVSPAGWTLPELAASIRESRPPTPATAAPPPNVGARWHPHVVHTVPRPYPHRELSGHPRLRRASPLSHFAASAALEALGPDRVSACRAGSPRLGLVYSLLNGCVAYTRKFYGEVLENPAMASPILFPETVFNAPASHLATYLGIRGPVYTVVGDSAQFLSAIDIALMWLEDDLVDECLVVGAEELDWLSAEALDLLVPGVPMAEGAAAVLVARDGDGPAIRHLEPGCPVAEFATRPAAARAARPSADCCPRDFLLVEDTLGNPRADTATLQAWSDWPGPRMAPGRLLGNGLGAAAAWQCALAWQEVHSGNHPGAIIAANGGNQQAAALCIA